MSITVPPHLRALGQTVGLKSWVDARSFPRDKYFTLIDNFKTELKAFLPDGSVESLPMVYAIAAALEAEQNLVEYVLKKHGDIADPEVWSKFLLSAGFHIYQRYVRETENGDWTADNGC